MGKQKQTQPKSKSRTYARNRAATTRRGYVQVVESDGTYFLKLVICVLLGTFWIKFADPISWQGYMFNAIPIGLIVGLVLIKRYETLQSDRKIWYAVLILLTILSYFVPAGIVI